MTVTTAELVAQGVDVGMYGLDQLKRADHAWVPVVTHLLEQLHLPDGIKQSIVCKRR